MGVTVWSQGREYFGGTTFGYFGKDTQPSTIVSAGHIPSSPFSTQTVNISARAQDQAGLSGIDWIQIRLSTNGGATYGAPIQSPGYGGAFDSTFTITSGPWATGTNACYEARAQDRAGNLSSWQARGCFLVRAGANLVVTLGAIPDKHVGENISATVYVSNPTQQNAGGFYLELCREAVSNAYNTACVGGVWTRWWISSLAAGGLTSRTDSPWQAPDPGVYPTTYRVVARADLDIALPGRVLETVDVTDNWTTRTYRVIGPFPWFQTTGGDVGSCERINPRIAPPPTVPPSFSADYLVIQNYKQPISNFTSELGWRVWDYNPLNIRPRDCPGPASMYDALFEKYNVDPSHVLPGNNPNNTGVGGNRVFFSSPTLSVPAAGVVYSSDPAIIFVNGDMVVNGNIVVNANTGIIFVVNGSVTVQHGVQQADGVYIIDGDYTVRSKGNNISPINPENQLVVNGAVIGGFNDGDGEFVLDRDFRSIANRTIPTEIFNFEPKYLWYFRDIVGDKKTLWKEVAP